MNLILFMMEKNIGRGGLFYSYILKEYIYLVRELRKNILISKDDIIFKLRRKIEKKIKIKDIILNKKLNFKIKLRYLKLMGRK